MTFLIQQINEVFASFGFEKKGSWYTNPEASYPVYFYVISASEILKRNEIVFTLELRNEINKKLRATDKQNTIASHFDPLISDRKSIYIGSQSGKNHTHIVIAHIKNLFTEGSDFKTVLTEVLNNNYMGERGFVKQTEMFIESLNLSHTN